MKETGLLEAGEMPVILPSVPTSKSITLQESVRCGQQKDLATFKLSITDDVLTISVCCRFMRRLLMASRQL